MFSQISIFFAVVFTESVISADVCGTTPISPNLNGFIVGGVEARPNSLPWQISMGYSYNGQHRCGGSIVSKDTIITAAHCITGHMAGSTFKLFSIQYYVDIGMHDLKGSHGQYYKRINVKKVIVHPQWNKLKISNFDMAILKLDTPITYSDGVQPICLPDPSQAYSSGEHFIASGWGDTKGTGNADKLRQVVVPYITSSVCYASYEKIYPGDSGIHDAVVCAGYASGGKDACQGDSGGPLAAMVNRKWTLAGVTSWGSGCAEAGSPGVYTNVAKYRSFIDQHLNERGLGDFIKKTYENMKHDLKSYGSRFWAWLTGPGKDGKKVCAVDLDDHCLKYSGSDLDLYCKQPESRVPVVCCHSCAGHL